MVKNVGNMDVNLLSRIKESERSSFRRSSGLGCRRQPDLHRMAQDRISVSKQPEPANVYCPSTLLDLDQLRGIVARVFEGQGMALRIDAGDKLLDVASISSAQARGLVGEDGYYGVEQTSDRIVEFAITMAGDDPGKLDKIKGAVDKGFGMATEALGGGLPDISRKTYDAIMEKLDSWAEAKNREGRPVL